VTVSGEILLLKETLNTMVDQLRSFAGEVTRVAREVGTEGRLGGQAQVPGRGHVEGFDRLGQFHGPQPHGASAQHRRVSTAIANGDLSRRSRSTCARDSAAEGNPQYDGRPAQPLRLGSHPGGARVGTEGKLGGQANVPGVAGTWKDLTENVNSMASNLTGQVRNIAEVTTAVARGDLSRKITVDVKVNSRAQEHHQYHVDQLNGFAGEVTRAWRARWHGRQARRAGPGARSRGHVEGSHDNVNSMAGNLTAQVRNIAEVATPSATGDLSRKITVDVRW